MQMVSVQLTVDVKDLGAHCEGSLLYEQLQVAQGYLECALYII